MGETQPGAAERMAQTVLDCGCNIEDSHVTVWGDSLSCSLLVSGNWNTLSKLETALAALNSQGSLQLIFRRTTPPDTAQQSMPYSVDVISLDKPGLVLQILGFFSARGVKVRELDSHSYVAPYSSTAMFTAHLSVEVPVSEHIASLRDDFLDLCDELNLDGVIEPMKP